MRLNKYISDTGLCSRREADQCILQGRVTINGQVAGLGSRVQPGDEVCVDHAPVAAGPRGNRRAKVYIALNKPVGITCTTERHVAGNIVDFVDHAERIFPIGRLDKDSEGLILLTNDGDIVNQVLRAENGHEKEYRVSVDRPVSEAFLAGMARGVRILGTKTLPCTVRRTGPYAFCIILKQGLNRQIRRMCATFGYRVKSLQRVRIMNIHLNHLKLGQWRNLTPGELKELRAKLLAPPAAAHKRAAPAPHSAKPRPQGGKRCQNQAS